MAARFPASTATDVLAASSCVACTRPRRSRSSLRSSTSSTPPACSNPGVLVKPAPVDANLRAAGPGQRQPRRPWFRVCRDGGDLNAGIAPLHRSGPLQERDDWARHGHVPVVHRYPRGEGLHPRSRAGAPGDGRRQVRPDVAGPSRARGAGPLPVLQGLRLRLPDGHRHGDVQVRGAPPDLPASAAATYALLPGPSADVGTAGEPDTSPGQPADADGHVRRTAASLRPGSTGARSIPPFADRDVSWLVRQHEAPRQARPIQRAVCCSSWTASPTPLRPTSGRQSCMCSSTPATACQSPTPASAAA